MKNSLAAGMQNKNSASLYTLLLPPWTFSRKSGQGNHRSAADLWFPWTDFRESVQGGSKSVYKIRKITSGHTQVHYFVNFVTCQQGDFERKIHFWTLLKQLLHLIWRRILVDKIYLSVQERKSRCFICCWNTSDLESILNRLHPDILQLWIWQNMS